MSQIPFNNRKPNKDSLLSFGFSQIGGECVYCAGIANGQLKLTVTVDANEKLHAKMTDATSGEEYVLHRVPDAAGAFVGQVKAEYEAVISAIVQKCFEPEVFKSEQAKAVIAYVRTAYGDTLEYLWQKFPDNAVVRRKDNRKWYAALLTVSRRKIGFDSDEPVEILDLRLNPEDMEGTVDHVRYFPGYHMNKKHWITLCLDGTVEMEEILRRIDASYALAQR